MVLGISVVVVSGVRGIVHVYEPGGGDVPEDACLGVSTRGGWVGCLRLLRLGRTVLLVAPVVWVVPVVPVALPLVWVVPVVPVALPLVLVVRVLVLVLVLVVWVLVGSGGLVVRLIGGLRCGCSTR